MAREKAYGRYFLPVIFILALNGVLQAQRFVPGSQAHYMQILEASGEKQAKSSLLLNGIYFDDPYLDARGHPYFLRDAFAKGTIEFRDQLYEDVLLKYDIADHRIIMDHEHPEYRLVTVIPNEFISSFTIGMHQFRKMELLEERSEYFEVIWEGDHIRCYRRWDKSRSVSHHLENKSSYLFSKSMDRNYLVLDGDVIRFRNNRTFIRALPESLQKDMKQYLRSEKIKIKKLTDKRLQHIIGYTDRLLNEN